MSSGSQNIIEVYHQSLGQYYLLGEGSASTLFCENETNINRLYNFSEKTKYYKDGINDHIVSGANTINPQQRGTKAALNYDLRISAGENSTIRLCLSKDPLWPFENFDEIFTARKLEADVFYHDVLRNEKNDDIFNIKRMALAGVLWNKQFYYFNVQQWLNGDPAQVSPPFERLHSRNNEWKHLNNKEILSVPDKWEYPWYAAWDMAFHCIPLAMVDIDFAKSQMIFLTKEWYMHPNGQLPAYEWNFSDNNPPVHALATLAIYKKEKSANNGKGDLQFLEKIFHKLMLNFTWWVNRKDVTGNNIFQGGFLGLDNIGIFDRSAPLPTGVYIEQADGTSWMAMYALNLLNMAHELSLDNVVYSEISAKFFEHFLYIAGAMNGLNEIKQNLWDDEDNFYYDRLRMSDNISMPLKVRSLVGLIPLFVVETFEDHEINESESFHGRMKWFRENRPDLANLISHWEQKNEKGKHLVSLMRGFRMKMTLKRLLDENEFLSEFGIRSVSKFHLEHPFQLDGNGKTYEVKYTPGESDTSLFGSNSNWRGPVWIPMNSLIIGGLRRFYTFYGDGFKVECPTASGNFLTLKEIADELSRRVYKIFERDIDGIRPVFNNSKKLQTDEHFKDYILFYEYFHGDTGKGLGASHQSGWTAMIVSDIFNCGVNE